MKKYVAFIAMVTMFFGLAITVVAAEEYEIKKGDNLWNIAQEYETTVEDLVEMNELKTTIIQPKQIIIVDDIYVVEKKDTLKSISKEFDVSIDELKEWNDLKNHKIKAGQELKVHDVSKQTKEDKTSKTKVTKKEKAKTKPKVEQATKQTSQSESQPEGQTIAVTATAYTAECDGCSGITYTGVNLNNDRNAKVIAVDPNVIPLGSKVYVEGYGHATAEDIGGAIKGNRIDLHVPTKKEAYNWGRQSVNITILD